MLIEVHILQNHSPSNLNRDDTGSPKEAIFGGYKRARISSQSLKRSIRRSEIFQKSVESQVGIRTRSLPELVRQRLIDGGVRPELAEIAAQKTSGFGTEAGKETKPNASGKYRTAQTMFLGEGDIAEIAQILKKVASDAGTPEKLEKIKAKDIQEMAIDSGLRPVAVDVALFGRMVTSEAFLDVDASSQFAHAISTHKIDHEFDYYTAVDDLERSVDDEAGSGADMIGDTEYNSACYYKYFNVHVEGLIRNLDPKDQDPERAKAVAAKAIRALVEAAARVSPSAKQNSFAAFQLPSTILVEIRPTNLPVSYANAFAEPVNPKKGRGLIADSQAALKSEAERLTSKYCLKATERLLFALDDDFAIEGVTPAGTIDDLLNRLEAATVGA